MKLGTSSLNYLSQLSPHAFGIGPPKRLVLREISYLQSLAKPTTGHQEPTTSIKVGDHGRAVVPKHEHEPGHNDAKMWDRFGYGDDNSPAD